MWELPWYSRWRSSLFLFLGISWGNTKIEQRSGQQVGESLLAGRIAGEGKGRKIAVSRRLARHFAARFLRFLNWFWRNRKRLLRSLWYSQASRVCSECGSKIRDFRRAFPVTLFTFNSPDPQLQFLRQESLVKIKTKYQHCDQTSANCQLHPQHRRIVQKLWWL